MDEPGSVVVYYAVVIAAVAVVGGLFYLRYLKMRFREKYSSPGAHVSYEAVYQEELRRCLRVQQEYFSWKPKVVCEGIYASKTCYRKSHSIVLSGDNTLYDDMETAIYFEDRPPRILPGKVDVAYRRGTRIRVLLTGQHRYKIKKVK